MASARDRSGYEQFTIESADGTKTVDIKDGVSAFVYYESVLSPCVTASVVVINTGGTITGKDGVKQGIYNGLPLRGGERVIIKVAKNTPNNDGLDFSDDPAKYFYVASITDVIVDAEREIFKLNLVSREAITNHTIRIGKKFPTSENISDSVLDILQNYLKTSKIDQVDQTVNQYGFIGNLKKPFYTIMWLASKSVPYNGADKLDSSAGFLFYETKNGFNFRSIDGLIKQDPYEEDYVYQPGIINSEDPLKDYKIVKYTINRNQDLIGKMQRGAYASQRYYINPVSFETIIRDFKSSDYMGIKGIKTLGEEELHLPFIEESNNDGVIQGSKTLGDLPTRIFVGMLDIGTVEQDASKKGWNDAAVRNADPMKIDAQTTMRYNQLNSNQVIEITIPLNTNLTAGNILRCIFPRIDREDRKSPDVQASGLYMIRDMAHYFDRDGSYTKLTMLRDSSGRK